MVSMLDTRQCANKEVEPRKGWTQSDMLARRWTLLGTKLGLDSAGHKVVCQQGRRALKGVN